MTVLRVVSLSNLGSSPEQQNSDICSRVVYNTAAYTGMTEKAPLEVEAPKPEGSWLILIS